jgi:AraC-like DNA-binding protein
MVPEGPARLHGYVPRPPLSRYVQLIWFVRGTRGPAREKVLPNGVVEVIINLGSPHRVVEEGAPWKATTFREAWVAGIQREAIIIEPTRESDLVGIRFKPGGAFALFGFPMAELCDRVVELDLIDRPFFAELRERLLEEAADEAKARLIEAALLARMRPEGGGDGKVGLAVQALLRGSDGLSMAGLCGQLGVSQKHLIHLFHQRVGMTPKLLARVLRFDAVIRGLAGAKVVRWAEVAQRYGYFDQAHLIADFRAFAGTTPRGYWQARSEDGAHIVLER